jgi:O-antigen/teichoic acid export membrane protein
VKLTVRGVSSSGTGFAPVDLRPRQAFQDDPQDKASFSSFGRADAARRQPHGRVSGVALFRRLWQLALISVSRFGGAAIGFVTQIFLARVLLPGDLGLYFLATSLSAFLAVVAALGLPSVTVRFLIRYQGRARGNLSRLFLRTSRSLVLLSSCLIAAAALLAINLWPGVPETTRLAASYGALAVPAFAMCRMGGVSATAFRRFNLSFLPDLFIRPAVFLAVIVGLFAISGRLSLPIVLYVFAILAAVQAVFQNVAVSRLVPADPHERHGGRIVKAWLRAALPMVSIGLLTAIFADVAILFAGFFLHESELALFGVCMKITVLAGFVVNTVYQLALPDLAEAFKARDTGRREKAVGLALLLGLGVSVGALGVGVVAGGPILGLFGPDYVGAKGLLVTLLLGQVLAAAGGPAVQLLTLSNGQSRGVWGSLVTVGYLFALDAALIPLLGLEGAAVAVVVANGVWAIWLAVQVKVTLGIRCDIGRVLTRTPRNLGELARE